MEIRPSPLIALLSCPPFMAMALVSHGVKQSVIVAYTENRVENDEVSTEKCTSIKPNERNED